MRLRLFAGAALFSLATLGRAQEVQEWKLNVAPFGLAKAGCVWYPGDVEFLDNERLVVSAPVAYTCDKSDRDTPLDTTITEIDLRGQELAEVHRSDVVRSIPGPIGYAAVCTGDHVELLSSSFHVAKSIPLLGSGERDGCYLIAGLSPSRTAMAIRGPSNGQISLYQVSSGEPIAEATTSKGESVGAVADDGFLICNDDKKQCAIRGSKEPGSSFPMPQLRGASGSYVVGLVAQDKWLLASFDGRRLYAETSTGETESMGDVAKIRLPFVGSSDTEMSAAAPRRVLYRVDGCPLGDFDDCYGVLFRRFAVFDSQTSRMLFRHSYAPGANLRLSPNGHIVMEQNGAEVHLFQLP